MYILRPKFLCRRPCVTICGAPGGWDEWLKDPDRTSPRIKLRVHSIIITPSSMAIKFNGFRIHHFFYLNPMVSPIQIGIKPMRSVTFREVVVGDRIGLITVGPQLGPTSCLSLCKTSIIIMILKFLTSKLLIVVLLFRIILYKNSHLFKSVNKFKSYAKSMKPSLFCLIRPPWSSVKFRFFYPCR